MTSAAVCRAVLAAALVASMFIVGAAPSLAARPAGEPGPSAIVGGSGPASDEPSARFGFSSVLNQVATSVTIVATSIDGPLPTDPRASSVRSGQAVISEGAPPPDPRNVIVRPGQEVTYRISGAIQNADAADVVVLFDSSLSYVTDTGDCFPTTQAVLGASSVPRPASLGGLLECFPVPFGINQPFNFLVIFQVNANAPSHTDPNFTVACVQNTPQSPIYNLCSAVAGTVVGPSPTPTPTPSVVVPPLVLPPLLPPPLPLLQPMPVALAPMPMPPIGPASMSGPQASVPVIPESDTLVLLGGGLAALGLLGAWRGLRRGRRGAP